MSENPEKTLFKSCDFLSFSCYLLIVLHVLFSLLLLRSGDYLASVFALSCAVWIFCADAWRVQARHVLRSWRQIIDFCDVLLRQAESGKEEGKKTKMSSFTRSKKAKDL